MQLLRTDPKSFYSALTVRTYDDCLDSPNKALSGIRKELGPEIGHASIVALLNIMLVDVITFFNVGKSMGVDQVKATVPLLIEEYWMLKPDDFKLCFNNAKKGIYGKIFDRLDGQIIMEWLEKYRMDRTEYADERNYKAHDRVKKGVEMQNRLRDAKAEGYQEGLAEAIRVNMVNEINKAS